MIERELIGFRRLFVCSSFALTALVATAGPTAAMEWFVAPGGTGNGSSSWPLGRIQDALAKAQAGDLVTVRPGTYAEALTTVRGGAHGAPIVVRGAGTRGSVVVSVAGRVLRVDHPYLTVEGLVLDGQYGTADTVDVNDGGDFLTLRNTEVRRSSRDLIDIGSPTGVLIEGCLIHHALNAAGGRTDAHGVAAAAVQGLTIRDTEIHTFSGDGLQVDPARLAPGWNGVVVERSRIWLAPLPAPENGFAAGVVPGENAIDTKSNGTLAPGTMEIRDTVAWGFRAGLLTNMAAFNFKENVRVNVDRVTVYDSEIAFRLRGPAGGQNVGAQVTVKNAVVYNSTTAFRYENDPVSITVWHSTIGLNVTRAFQAASSNANGLEVRNVAFLGTVPAQASHPSNRGVTAAAFVNAGAANYRLTAGASLIDSGLSLPSVTNDRAGTARPQGAAPDIGAYEWVPPVSSADDVVVYPWRSPSINGEWRVVAADTAAGYRIWHPDAGYGVNVLGPTVRFATTGYQTIRVQTKEDGLSLDQVVLSASEYLTEAPGTVKGDETILHPS